LINKPQLQKTKALKVVDLYLPQVKIYEENDTDNMIVDIRTGFAVDHYGAQYFMYGSQGTV
jgi:hypothetical protein